MVSSYLENDTLSEQELDTLRSLLLGKTEKRKRRRKTKKEENNLSAFISRFLICNVFICLFTLIHFYGKVGTSQISLPSYAV